MGCAWHFAGILLGYIAGGVLGVGEALKGFWRLCWGIERGWGRV